MTSFLGGDGHRRILLAVENAQGAQQLRIWTLRDSKWEEEEALLPEGLSFEHVRQFRLADLNADGWPEIIVSDHGFDRPPFKGGVSQLLVWSEGKYKAQKLGDSRAFTFHSEWIDFDGDGDLDILQMNIGEPGPRLFQNEGQFAFKDVSPLLSGGELSPSASCRMTAQRVRGNTARVIIGGCGIPTRSVGAASNQMIEIQNGQWLSKPETLLPNIMPAKDWGTNGLLAEDFNGDGQDDILTLIHNFGYTRAQAGIYLSQSDSTYKQVALDISPYNKVSGFFIWPYALDLNADQKKDLVLIFRFTEGLLNLPSLVLLKNDGGGAFSNVTNCLVDGHNDIMGFAPLEGTNGALALAVSWIGTTYQLLYIPVDGK